MGYTGEWYDAAVGLVYLRARWLDVATGRFTQRDPARWGQNHYWYADANPVNLVDPSGLYSIVEIKGIFGAAFYDPDVLRAFHFSFR